MSFSVQILKKQAKAARTFLQEKCGFALSHGHSLEMVSQMHDFKDWNTASAASRPSACRIEFADTIETVGDLKRALDAFDESAIIDASYDFKLKDFEIDPLSDPDDTVCQEFSLSLKNEDRGSDIVSMKLKLENESMITHFGPLKEDCGFFENGKSDGLNEAETDKRE